MLAAYTVADVETAYVFGVVLVCTALGVVLTATIMTACDAVRRLLH